MRGTGTISVVMDPGFAGATFELAAATGAPWYMAEDYNWSPDLTATTSRGIGGFTEVTPGEVQVSIGGTAADCVPEFASPGNEPNSIRLLVKEGYVTAVGVICPPPP
jgi:hypothetical protein